MAFSNIENTMSPSSDFLSSADQYIVLSLGYSNRASAPISQLLLDGNNTIVTTSPSAINDDLEYWQNMLNIVRLLCMKIYPPLICSLGIIANVLNIVVLTRRLMASSTNVYLTAVALGDLCYLTLFFVYSASIYQSARRSAWYSFLVPPVRSTANVCSNTTTWLTVTFTVERYIAVCHPMVRHKICTKERARWIVGLVSVVCFLLTLPDYFMFKVVPPEHAFNGTFKFATSSLGITLSKYGYSYANQVVFIVIPLTLLIVFNTLLVRSVIRASKFRKGMLQAGGKDTTSRASAASTTPPHGHHRNSAAISAARKQSNTLLLTNDIGRKTSNTFSLSSTAQHRNSSVAGRSRKGSSVLSTNTNNGNVPSSSNSNRRNRSNEQQRITLMLIVVVITFVVLQLPSTVSLIIDSLVNAEKIYLSEVQQLKHLIFGNFVNDCLLTSAALNFVLYSFFSAKFRETFVTVLPCCRGQRAPIKQPISSGNRTIYSRATDAVSVAVNNSGESPTENNIQRNRSSVMSRISQLQQSGESKTRKESSYKKHRTQTYNNDCKSRIQSDDCEILSDKTFPDLKHSETEQYASTTEYNSNHNPETKNKSLSPPHDENRDHTPRFCPSTSPNKNIVSLSLISPCSVGEDKTCPQPNTIVQTYNISNENEHRNHDDAESLCCHSSSDFDEESQRKEICPLSTQDPREFKICSLTMKEAQEEEQFSNLIVASDITDTSSTFGTTEYQPILSKQRIQICNSSNDEPIYK